MNGQNKTLLTAKDYASDQEVRWCPGCGDYAILKTMTQVLSKLQLKKEDTVFISGIGCASRFPYYLDTYGFHTIHGRAPTVATGVKLSNPDLSVWVVTGDGDGLSIGGNHLLHLFRRNLDTNVLLFNNEIYGLTKGQYSPTSRPKTISPSSPRGSIGSPVSPGKFAHGCGATFIARSIDTDKPSLSEVLERSHQHRGTALVEILQNCIVYNDKIFDDLSNKESENDRQLRLKHGMPLVFGSDLQYGLAISSSLELEIINAVKNPKRVLNHDETNANLAQMLLALDPIDYPVPIGVIYAVQKPIYEELFHQSGKHPFPRKQTVNSLIESGEIWEVTKS